MSPVDSSLGRHRRRRLRISVAGAVGAITLAASPALVSCGHATSPARSSGTDAATDTGQNLEPATPRGLTSALLSHLDRQATSHLSGLSHGGTVSSSVELDDAYQTSLFVSATSPTASPEGSAECGNDSGYSVVTCRVDAAGDLIEVARGPERSAQGRIPLLIGHAYRKDGSNVLLEIHVRGASPFPRELAEAVLSDPLIGWETSASLNAQGRELASFEKMRLYASATDVGE
jgi:hypothetical protein